MARQIALRLRSHPNNLSQKPLGLPDELPPGYLAALFRKAHLSADRIFVARDWMHAESSNTGSVGQTMLDASMRPRPDERGKVPFTSLPLMRR